MPHKLLAAGILWACCGLLAGCAGRPPMYQGAQPYGQPQYITLPAGPPISSPAPIASPPNSSPTPIASPPSDGSPNGGSGISLTPAARTSMIVVPGFQTWRTPTAVTPLTFAPPGPRYADAGRYLDGRLVSGGSLYASASVSARPLKSALGPGSMAEHKHRRRAGRIGQLPSQTQIVGGMTPTPNEDMKYRGGRIIKDLTYINVYIGGKQAWSESDRKNIDWALNAAMIDPYLNHVLMQYFNDQPISSSYNGSFILEGYKPQRVTQSNVKELTRILYTQGALKNYPLSSTVINFFLPSGVILADPDAAQQAREVTNRVIPHEEESSSLEGLGGYHGSIHMGSDTVYYAIGVYSERRSNGWSNGIPVFDQSWKNIVATFYHELQEARTDPDVDDAITTGQERYIGWTSDSGEEVADSPVGADGNDGRLDQVFVEVPLANGSGKVPVQLCYSNAVHGPEGPIKTPHRGSPLPIPPASPPPWSSPSSPPPSNPPNSPPPSQPGGGFDPGLDLLTKEWDFLPESVKAQIIKLIQDSL